jgi:mutator protein MutT
MQEMIDIYDRERNHTGITIPREGAFLKEGQYMLYVIALIEAPDGRILITQRSQEKHWAAGWWEVTGGGVAAGETSEQAIVRELAEEVGLDVADYPLERIYTYENVDPEGGDNYIVDIYHFHLDITEKDVTLQESEAIGCKFATWDEIKELADQGVFLHFSRLRQALLAEKAVSC